MDWQNIFATRSTRMKASEIRELLKLLEQPDIISFAGGIPDPELFPAQAFQKAFADALNPQNAPAALQYSVSEGYAPLRDWIAKQMAKLGVPCTRDHILITSGSQQALDYLGKLLVSPGDRALVEWPTYLGALGAFNAYEPDFERLDLGTNSLGDPTTQTGGPAKFAYTVPDFANPTGKTMSRAEREALIQLADNADIAILEDAAYQALRYDGDPVPPIIALEIAQKGSIDACRTIYCGSFSKTLSPGLRVGWVCAATPVISKLVLMKQAADLHSSTINQMAVAAVAQDGFDAHLTTVRKTYAKRRDLMLAALDRHMPAGVSWTRPEGGMFIWLTLPKLIETDVLLATSLKTERVAFVPGHAFFADGSGKNTLRLSYSQASPEAIDEGIRRLSALISAA